ncbi:hypothetical protein BKA70DRAFT_1491834, partial [Coprinopsis sp. MPI-PUGE-AT-0042]
VPISHFPLLLSLPLTVTKPPISPPCRKHTGERPFSCHCGKQFSRLDNLRQHAQTVHADKQDQNEKMMRDLTSLHATMAAANKVGGGGGGGGGRRRGGGAAAKDTTKEPKATGGAAAAKATSRREGSPPLVIQPKKEDLGGLIPFHQRPGTSTGYEGEMYWPDEELAQRRGVRGIPPRSGGGSHSFRDPRINQSFLAPTNEQRSAGGPSAPGQSFRVFGRESQQQQPYPNGRFHADRDRPKTSIDPASASISRTSSREHHDTTPVYLERPRTSAVSGNDGGYGYGPGQHVYGGRPRPSTSAAPSSAPITTTSSGRFPGSSAIGSSSRPPTSAGLAPDASQRPEGRSRPGTAGAAASTTLPPLSAVFLSSQLRERGEPREYGERVWPSRREPASAFGNQQYASQRERDQRLPTLPGSRPDSGYGGYSRGRYEYDEYEYAGARGRGREYDDDDDDGYGGGYGGLNRPTTAPAFFASRAPNSLRLGARTELPPPPGSSRGRYASPPPAARERYQQREYGAGSPIQWDDDNDERRRSFRGSRDGRGGSPIRADSPPIDDDDENGGDNPFYFQPPALVSEHQQYSSHQQQAVLLGGSTRHETAHGIWTASYRLCRVRNSSGHEAWDTTWVIIRDRTWRAYRQPTTHQLRITATTTYLAGCPLIQPSETGFPGT